MKDKAKEIMRYYIEGYYDTKYDPGASRMEKYSEQNEMRAVRSALFDLGLLTREEFRAMKEEIHTAKNAEWRAS